MWPVKELITEAADAASQCNKTTHNKGVDQMDSDRYCSQVARLPGRHGDVWWSAITGRQCGGWAMGGSCRAKFFMLHVLTCTQRAKQLVGTRVLVDLLV